MKQKNIMLMATLALMGAMTIASCDNEDNAIVEEPVVAQNNIVTVSTTISLDDSDPTTRALTEDGVKTFAYYDKVAMSYQNTSGEWVKATSQPLKNEDITNEGKTATLTFELVNPCGGTGTLVYPASFLLSGSKLNISGLQTQQDGTFANIKNNYDVCYASLTIDGGDGFKLKGPYSPMKNMFCIAKFTIKDDKGTVETTDDEDVTSQIKQLTIMNGTTSYKINRTPAAGPIYVAMLPNSGDEVHIADYSGPTGSTNFSFTAVTGTKPYKKTVTGGELYANKIYPINLTMTEDTNRETPLTFEAKTAGANVTFNIYNGLETGKTVEYSTDGTNWSSYTSGTAITLENVGDKVSFRGDYSYYSTSSYFTWTSEVRHSYFSCDKECYVYGNVMSLVSPTNYAAETSLSSAYTFVRLFDDATYGKNILSATDKPLVLPANSLSNYCYAYMFRGCTSLTTAPELPATTLTYGVYYYMFENCASLTTAPVLNATLGNGSTHCYEGMFYGCTSLATAPALPSTKVSQYCYAHMFGNCTSLTTAPVILPATTLIDGSTIQEYCYYGMFEGCTSLTTAPILPATTLSRGCYMNMFLGCTSLITAPALPAKVLTQSCYWQMFQNCTKLTAAPALNAQEMIDGCYLHMFCGCTSLEIAPALPSTWLAYQCYEGMFKGCTKLETAPDLPATILAKECYKSMFEDCTKLNSVKCLAKAKDNEAATDCTTDWLKNVAATGTFTKNSEMISWTWEEGASGIPAGWTVNVAP